MANHYSGRHFPNRIPVRTEFLRRTATITLTDSKGTKIKMITGSSGNFYTGTAISFPATVEVSKCPDTVAMKATITAGGCNNCHTSSMRVHLP